MSKLREEVINKIKSLPDNTIDTPELISSIAKHGLETGDTSLYSKIKEGYEFLGLYPHTMTTLNVVPENETHKKKTLKITIEGVVNSGKSNVLYFIKNALKEKGFEVEFNGIDHTNESEFDDAFKRINKLAISSLTEKIKINITEKQLNPFKQ